MREFTMPATDLHREAFATVQPKARRTVRLGESQMAIGFAVGGEPGSRLSDRLAMPVSADALLRMICAAGFEPARSAAGGWHRWRKVQRYGVLSRKPCVSICGIGTAA
ncbi:hypothetical protein [Mesorhizobium sp.]|uniref:hypothetical protein n=1 Tax=Mesorhizobium sp. TaxID=1871066 RepID=UPI00257BAFAC|nr:hypothetical protein [Mesorhizobium sp.]